MNSFLFSIFDKYADLLKRRFSEDFLEIVSTDDYMPMPIQNPEEFDKVVNVSWYTPDRPREEMAFPCVFPFSQMYPLCCIDIRNFLNQFYFFSSPDSTTFTHTEAIDHKLRDSLDDLLTTKVCDSLVSKLSSQYLGQIVQILINLEYFEIACHELESLLANASRTQSATDTSLAIPLPTTHNISAPKPTLKATAAFHTHKTTATNRIYSLINSKLTDLIDSADYEWLPPPSLPNPINPEPSPYLPTLTTYLTNITSTVLLSLPPQLKASITQTALSHTASSILQLLLSPSVPRINQTATRQLQIDVDFLTDFANSLSATNPTTNPPSTDHSTPSTLTVLSQSISLMNAPDADEFYEIGVRQRKYGAVDPLTGPILLEKVVRDAVPKSNSGIIPRSGSTGIPKSSSNASTLRGSGGVGGLDGGAGGGMGGMTRSWTGAIASAGAGERTGEAGGGGGGGDATPTGSGAGLMKTAAVGERLAAFRQGWSGGGSGNAAAGAGGSAGGS